MDIEHQIIFMSGMNMTLNTTKTSFIRYNFLAISYKQLALSFFSNAARRVPT